jgi:hypothetical protein
MKTKPITIFVRHAAYAVMLGSVQGIVAQYANMCMPYTQ